MIERKRARDAIKAQQMHTDLLDILIYGHTFSICMAWCRVNRGIVKLYNVRHHHLCDKKFRTRVIFTYSAVHGERIARQSKIWSPSLVYARVGFNFPCCCRCRHACFQCELIYGRFHLVRTSGSAVSPPLRARQLLNERTGRDVRCTR